MNEQIIFSTLTPTRLFFKCAIPSMIGTVVSSLYTIADGIFVGRYIGAEALAAINLVMPFIMISMALADMVAVGSSVQISMQLGKGEQKKACRMFSFCSLLIVAISCVVGLGGYFFAEPLVRLMGAEEAVVLLAAEYMRVYSVFAPGIMIFFALDNYLRVCGKTTYSMVMNIAIALANIVLDWLFIAQFGWGIASAAFASCISLLAGTVIGILPFLSGKLTLRYTKPYLQLRTLANILGNGSSEFFSNISASAFMVMVNAALLNLSGSMAVAAFSIVMYIDSIVTSMLFGMAGSVQPAISYNYGAGARKRVVAIERCALLVGAIISISAMLFMLLGSGTLIQLFMQGSQPELLEMSTRAMILFSLSYLVGWFGMVASSFFTALNKPIHSLLVSMAQTFFFPLLFLSILPRFLGLDGVWLMTLAAEIGTAILAGVFLFCIWRKRLRQ